MGYFIEVDGSVCLYLDSEDRRFSPQDRDVIDAFLDGLADTGEWYRADASFRCSPGSANMEIDYVFLDSAGNVRRLQFIVSDAAAVHGVLRVTYVDEV